ncbi:uncharacterized protein B0H18DRAFT_1120134 [Fomitopsis serialis]|uniref:uncharacterized protein n=1 Tax=Fomitopsis serialis TaxID=139415 RepID=UPI002007D05E|nr:uncharacterized protein B0H18DRAFT_1120134 [Neoantrodia serialis]KAH9924059.1 hypothetical protein B0H18DRAFT_1120134 [Neoantrodia serialis]
MSQPHFDALQDVNVKMDAWDSDDRSCYTTFKGNKDLDGMFEATLSKILFCLFSTTSNALLAIIMSLLTLNDDILHIIADMLSAAECLPLSSVSRDLHAISRQYVFASITVRTAEQLVKMHDHLIHNIDNRLIWPRGLTIYGPAEMAPAGEASAVNALVGILEHARELKALVLFNCEEAICCNTLVGEHLAALPNLSDVGLWDVGTKTLDVLHKMASRPERLRVCLSPARLEQDRFLTHIARTPVLNNVKELMLYGVDGVPPLQLVLSLAGAHPQEASQLTDWLAYTPCDILRKNFPKSTLEHLPTREKFIFRSILFNKSTADEMQPCANPTRRRLTHNCTRCSRKSRSRSPAASAAHAVINRRARARCTSTRIRMSGKAKVTVFTEQATRRYNVVAGGVMIVPRNYGHYIEYIGDEPIEMLEIFKAPKFEELLLNQWLPVTPPHLVQAHLTTVEEGFTKALDKGHTPIRDGNVPRDTGHAARKATGKPSAKL